MDNFRLAVKAFIVKNGQVLLLQRRSNDAHKPGEWDIPGGRLEIGEDPTTGVQREVLEESGLKIKVLLPLNIRHFVRDDGQKITMIIFLCQADKGKIKLSKEHQAYRWLDLNSPQEEFPRWLDTVVDNFNTYKLGDRLK